MDDIVAAADAIRAQARSWDDLADTVSTAHARLVDLKLPAEAFSAAKDAKDAKDAKSAENVENAKKDEYDRRSDHLAGMLRRAGEDFDRIARELRSTADTYDEGDRAAADRVGRVR